MRAQPFPPWPACTRSVTRSANSATMSLFLPCMRKAGQVARPAFWSCCCAPADLRRRLCGNDVHGPAAVERTELHCPADQGEQRVVAAAAYPVAPVEMRAVLAADDLAPVHQLAAVTPDAEALGL